MCETKVINLARWHWGSRWHLSAQHHAPVLPGALEQYTALIAMFPKDRKFIKLSQEAK